MGLWASLRAAVGTAPASPAAEGGATVPQPPGDASAGAGAEGHGPAIEKNACRACGACLDECPEGVFALGRHDDAARVARPADCNPECDRCAAACPQDGISFPGR